MIAVSTLKAFWSQPEFRDSEMPLRSWLEEVRDASWRQPADIKAQFGSASILKNRRAVFIKRLHQRYNALRVARERKELLAAVRK